MQNNVPHEDAVHMNQLGSFLMQVLQCYSIKILNNKNNKKIKIAKSNIRIFTISTVLNEQHRNFKIE